MNKSCEPLPARTYKALDDLLQQAEARLQAAPDDDLWVKHFMIWLSLHRLKFADSEPLPVSGPEMAGVKT